MIIPVSKVLVWAASIIKLVFRTTSTFLLFFGLLVISVIVWYSSSLREGRVPTSFKMAAITPLIKKANLDPEILKNYSMHAGHRIMGHRYDNAHKFTTTQPVPAHNQTERNYFRVVGPGETIRAGSRQVHIITASFYSHKDSENNFHLFLNGWAKHKTNFNMNCCLYESLQPSATSRVVQVTSRVHHEYAQWVVDMQNLELTCPMEKGSKFKYVTFTDTSCPNPGHDDVTRNSTNASMPIDVMEIIFPEKVTNSVGICLKVSYGSLDAIKVLEWFEYARIMGVTKVFTYFWDLDAPALRLFKYYQDIGFLDLLPIYPATSDGGKPRGFRRPRYEEQAWVDEVTAANDCKHRMAGFDYVIVMDVDEYIFPKPIKRKSNTGYFSILKEANAKEPKSGGFSFDAHVVMLDWNKTRSSPLMMCSYVNRTNFANYERGGTQTRWAFRPRRMHYVQNNRVWPTQEYSWINVPRDLYTLFHFRFCKSWKWTGCSSWSIRERDESLTRYEGTLVKNILDLPVDQIMQDNKEYVQNLRVWHQSQLKGNNI